MVRVPPPLIFAAGIGAGILLHNTWPLSFHFRPWTTSIGLALIALALSWMLWALVCFRRARTTVSPFHASNALITAGPFGYSRNPLYLGLSVIQIGIGLASDNLWMLLLLVPVVWLIQVAVITREEAFLQYKFGDDYQAYTQRVRRWF